LTAVSAATTFAWRGRHANGEPASGRSEAHDAAAVADQLRAAGVVPVAIEPVAAEAVAAPTGWQLPGRNRVTDEDLMLLSRQLAALHKAGVPLLRSLAGLQASTPNPALIALLADLRNSLDQGRELAAAMARHPAVFSTFYISIIRVGEMTGRLTEAFARVADHLESELDMRARIRAALRYPILVLGAIAIAMVVINLFVIPTFAEVFAGFKAELPVMTRLLLGVSGFTVAWWPLLLAGVAGAVWGLRRWLAQPAGRMTWDRWKLRLPVAGVVVSKATLARFARSFAMASGSGVPITSTLSVVAQTVDNAFVGARIEQMREGVERCATASGVFSPVVLQMIAVGEETGELDALLTEVADLYERETDHAIKGLSASIEPLLLTIVGAMVLVLALGVFLPLWNLGQVAGAGR
jgi:MSHA biogenesis protein MshG